eukprot:CAMPEP_0173465768 /NCGR_PEP_ID=MMETSP1357-20121228/72198_1 /TAXON_ID=77926 /ORGANISM="Hemiselmis rufescens, Strain PCC563" /LENGTH=392 /DNA_ID=CAMNT_0014433767 /DNA_START=280 /DNA_END=1455 /DNA_ORIENTATION=+
MKSISRGGTEGQPAVSGVRSLLNAREGRDGSFSAVLGEMPTEHIMPMREPRIWVLGGIREEGPCASCCSWNGEFYMQQKGRDQGLLLAQQARKETDIQNTENIPRPRSGCAAAMIKGRLWLMGGFSDKHGVLSSVISRDKKSPYWRVEPKMNKRRDGLCCIAYDEGGIMSEGSLIIMGGNNGAAFTNTVERAPLVNAGNGVWELGEWQDLPKMMYRRGNFSACTRMSDTKEHLIYAIGGFSDGKEGMTDTMERLDLATTQWIISRPLNEKRAGHSACFHGERIFLAGGSDGSKTLKTVETFDPREGRWRQTVSLKKARTGHSLVSLNGRLFAIGGRSYMDEFQRSDQESMVAAALKAEEGGAQGLVEALPQHETTEFLHVIEHFDDRAVEWR